MNKFVSDQLSDERVFSAFYEGNRVSLEAGGQETALAAYEQAIRLAPHEAMLHYRKGQVLEQMGRHSEAQKTYELARILDYKKR